MGIYDVVPVTYADYRQRARRKLPHFLFDYIDGAANSEVTARRNESDFGDIRLRQRVMRDVSDVSTVSSFCGEAAALPLALAPVGMAGMFARRGEAQAGRAAGRVGVPFTTSTLGICSVEEVGEARGEPCWFQLYMLRDRDIVLKVLERVWNAGVRTLAFTVDLAVPGLRMRDFRNGMVGGGLPGKLSRLAGLVTSPQWVWDVGVNGKPHGCANLSGMMADANDLEAYRAFVEDQFDASVTWNDIRWLREQWKGTLIIKGVMEPDDAQAAVDCGANAVLVSNHGGRQLDGIHSTVARLPEVAAAVGSSAEVYLDGGVRSGIDVLKALALGADGVFIGRAWVYALAARGETGVEEFLRLFQRELSVAMALAGVKSLDAISADIIER